ncbi:hypothetical protein ACXYMX_03200 [Sporosarcina sp. CAU 1771]
MKTPESHENMWFGRFLLDFRYIDVRVDDIGACRWFIDGCNADIGARK